MKIKNDIQGLEDIILLVDTFYKKVQHDPVIGPIFHHRIGENWEPHLKKMYSFWQTVLLEENTYSGRPFLPHASMPIGAEHFRRWLELFQETLNELFEGAKTEEAIWRANKMAELFLSKLNYIQNNPGKNIL